MLVIIGANGRTGVEILKLALARGLPVRPVCRDDRDTRVLDGVVDVQRISYADPDHPASLAPVMVGARQVVIAIDARVAGPGAPLYQDHAGGHCIQAATEAGAEVALYLSVAGGYRWSPSRLNRRAFHLDRWVRRSQGRWSMMRFSCFHDEVIEGHVRPPDGGRPHPVPPSSRYAPLSRADAARVVVGCLPTLVAGRTIYVGGPEMLYTRQVEQLIAPQVVPGSGPRTRFFPLPPGDVSVLPEATRVAVGMVPTQTLAEALAPQAAARPSPWSVPLPQRPPTGPHPADQGHDYKVLAEWGPDLRHAVHRALVEDLAHLGLPTEGVTLSFRHARAAGDRAVTSHDGTLRPLVGVRAEGPTGEVLHKAPVDFLHDPLARELRIWWRREDGAIPREIWRELDLGVKRRAVMDPAFAADGRVQAFSDGHEQVRAEGAEA